MIEDVPVVITEISVANPNRMRQLVDQLRKQFQPIAVLLAASSEDGKVLLVAGVTRDLVEQGISAGNWVKEIAPVVGGGGGGKPDLAQAGERAGVVSVEVDRLPDGAAVLYAVDWRKGQP